jgi:hypothetical protein
MSDPTSIFNNDPDGNPITPDPSKVTAPTDQEVATLLLTIKNERGEPKYKNLHDALVGLQHAQTYIPELKQTLSVKEQELATAKLEAQKVATLEDTIRQLTERPNPDGTPPSVMSPQDIANLVNKQLQELNQKSVQEKNVKTVIETMKEAFGDEAEKIFIAKAAEAGMTVAEFNSLAARSPKLVLGAVGVTEKQATKPFSPTQSTVNSQAFTPRKDTLIGRNDKPVQVGATTSDVMEESKKSRAMVDELHEQGLTVGDLSNPKEYFKHFGKK